MSPEPVRAYKSAALSYKETVAGLSAAADALRERDRERAGELARALVGREDDMARAAERAALSRLGVDLHWEAALDALWTESWLQLRPLPDPEPSATPADLAALDVAVEVRSAELQAAVRRRRFGLPGR